MWLVLFVDQAAGSASYQTALSKMVISLMVFVWKRSMKEWDSLELPSSFFMDSCTIYTERDFQLVLTLKEKSSNHRKMPMSLTLTSSFSLSLNRPLILDTL